MTTKQEQRSLGFIFQPFATDNDVNGRSDKLWLVSSNYSKTQSR